MLQIRISVPDFTSGVAFTDPIILENADNISLVQSITLGQDSISFTLSPADAKIGYLSERIYGSGAYLRWWECWDTETNERLGYGPIDSMDDTTDAEIKISGPSRHALLRDFAKTVQTFYQPISSFLNDLRFENITGEPRTATLINDTDGTEYHGLSKRTQGNAIDEQTGYLSPGRDTPARGQLRTDSYWAGTGRADWITIDLGDDYAISRSRVLLPWWGGLTINNSRTYDWTLSYSNDNISYTVLYDTGPMNFSGTPPSTRGYTFHMGDPKLSNEAIAFDLLGAPVLARYWKIDITATHARYAYHLDGNNFSASYTDEWDWECGGSNTFQGDAKNSPSTGTINKKVLHPDNDCYASVVEFETDRMILGKDFLSSIYYQQIANENLQITYSHIADPSETINTTVGNTRKYEPGVVFRNATFTWTSNPGTLEVWDEFNTRLYHSTSASGTHGLQCPANTQFLRFTGGSDVVVTASDCWIGILDPLSFEGRYEYTPVLGDTAVLHFRGLSVKWYATIPVGSTPGQVSIELRSMGTGGVWNSWDVIEPGITLPVEIAAEKVWEITYESGILAPDTTYELRITNLNGGYVSIDAFAGFWEASFQQVNEDDPRWYVRFPNDLKQLYDATYSNQSIYEYPTSTPAFTRETFNFRGDRLIIYSLKKPGAGTIKFQFTSATLGQMPIPGGDADGALTVNLDSTHTIPQAVIFDTDQVFGGLAWDFYGISFYQRSDSTGSMFIDGIAYHGESGLSTKFENTTYIQILQDTTEALQMESQVTEDGIRVIPRIGTETNEVVRDGGNTTISIGDVKDISQMATMLQLNGADIDGLPLTGLIEDKISRKIFGRTIQRTFDLRNVSDQFTLIGAGRGELVKRRKPQNRVTIAASAINFELGDSFTVVKALSELRVRAVTITRNQSRAGGTNYAVDCVEWLYSIVSTIISPPAPLVPPPLVLEADSGDTEVALEW